MKMYFAVLVLAVCALPASAHPGKTDGLGGHKCYKECAEWDLYYAEYHLHDKDGKAVKVAKKTTVKTHPDAAIAEEKKAVEGAPAAVPADAIPVRPVAVAPSAVAEEYEGPSLPWILLILFLVLLLVIRRRRNKVGSKPAATT